MAEWLLATGWIAVVVLAAWAVVWGLTSARHWYGDDDNDDMEE